MLAHEIAHWHRRDALWLVVSAVVQSLFFFQPLNWLARKRLVLLAELSADDWSVAHTGHGLALAECLAAFAEATQRYRAPVFAAAMAQRRSALVERVERLLAGGHRNGRLTLGTKLAVGVIALLGVAVLPRVVAQAPATAPERATPSAPAEDPSSRSVGEPLDSAEAPEARAVPGATDVPDVRNVPNAANVPDIPDPPPAGPYDDLELGELDVDVDLDAFQ